jgi:hypothetical protein
MLRHSSERCITTTISIDHDDIRLQPTKAGSESGSWSTAYLGSRLRRRLVINLLAAPTTPQVGAWSTLGPWSPVVDEPHSLVIGNCGLTQKPVVTCVFGSQHFSSLHAIFHAHVPWVCPGFPPGWAHGSGGRRRNRANLRGWPGHPRPSPVLIYKIVPPIFRIMVCGAAWTGSSQAGADIPAVSDVLENHVAEAPANMAPERKASG